MFKTKCDTQQPVKYMLETGILSINRSMEHEIRSLLDDANTTIDINVYSKHIARVIQNKKHKHYVSMF